MADNESKKGLLRFLVEYTFVAGLAIASYDAGYQNLQADHNPDETGPLQTIGHAALDNARLLPFVPDSPDHGNESTIRLLISDLGAVVSIGAFALARDKH